MAGWESVQQEGAAATASRDALALVHAGLGERDEVFECLDRAYTTRDVHLVFLTVDPKWDPYRADPRFDVLLGRCGFIRTA